MSKCFVTRAQFLDIVGVVSATITQPRTAVVYSTKNAYAADRVHTIGERVGARVVRTFTDERVHVVSVRGFKR